MSGRDVTSSGQTAPEAKGANTNDCTTTTTITTTTVSTTTTTSGATTTTHGVTTTTCPKGGAESGDPVITASGAFVSEGAESYLETSGGNLSFERTMLSISADSTGEPMGRWQTEALKRLTVSGSDVTVKYIGRDTATFSWNGSSYSSSFGAQDWQLFKDSAFGGDGSGYCLVQGGDPPGRPMAAQTPAALYAGRRGGANRRWFFGSTGRLTRITDPFANTYDFLYDANGCATTITNSAGRPWKFYYDAGKRLTRLVDSRNMTADYQYVSASDHLTKATGLTGRTASYQYDSSHRITAQYDGNGSVVLQNWYDSTSRVTKQVTGVGTYTWGYSGVGACSVTTTDTSGNEIVNLYDSGYLLTRRIVKANRGVHPGGSDATVDNVYDGYGRLTKMVYARGTEERYSYDSNGNVLTRVVAADAGSSGLARTYEYEGSHFSVTRETDPNGNAVIYLRDGNGLVTRIAHPTVNKGQPSAQTGYTDSAYDSTGQITRQVDLSGAVTAYQYDSNGFVRTTIADEGGLNLTTAMNYDTIGNLTEQISAEGNRKWLYYDGSNRVTRDVQVLDNSDTSKQYSISYWYDNTGQRVSKKVEHKDGAGTALSPSEYLVVWGYDTQFRLTRETYQVDGSNAVTRTYYLDGSGRATKIIAPNGTATEKVYDEQLLVYQDKSCGGCGSTQVTYDYDGNGNVVTKTDAVGNKTLSAYDAYDRVTRTSQYDATPTLLSYEEQEYDANGNVTRSTTRDGSDTVVARSTYYYDEINRLYDTRNWANPGSSEADDDARTVYLYDAASRLTKQKTYLSGADASPVVAEAAYYYDNAGRQTSVVDAEGGATSYAYDKDGRLTRTTDAESRTTDYVYDRLGRVTRQTDAAGNYVAMQYDSLGHAITTVNYASGGTAMAKAAQDYDGLGRVTLNRRFADPGGAADDTKDYKTIAYYDANGLVTKTQDAAGNLSTAYYDTYNRVQWQRDPLGNKVEYVYDSNNNVITSVSYEIDMVNGSTKTFNVAQLYDGRNRVTKTADQGKDGDITQTNDNGVTSVYYDALSRKTKLTDAESVATVWSYHALGRLTRQTDDYGGLNRNKDQAYDRAGRMTRITDDLSQSTDYSYDRVSRLTRTAYALANDTVDQYYDKSGTMTKRVDQRGIATLYMYDAVRWLTKKQDDPTSPNTVEEYAQDGLGRMTLAKLTRGGSEHSDVRYYYDGLGRTTRESQKIKASTARNVDAVYDKAGNRITLTYPGGKSVAYTYDADSRVSRILDGANARARYLYVGPSRRSQVELFNGANTVSTYKLLYDGVARITSALYRNAADDATIVGFLHDYDKVGNPKYEIRTHQSSYGDAYMYDKLYRVTRVIYDDSNPVSPTYAVERAEDFLMDPIGNRTKLYAKSETATEYLHNPVNEYTKVGSDTYLYDAAGNLTKDANFAYYWDYENRLTKVKKVSDASDVAEYTYDAKMRRIEKIDYTQDPSVTTRFYQEAWNEIEERDGNDSTIAAYLNGPDIDDYISFTRSGNEYWYMQSPIVGNVCALVNSSGAMQEGNKYTAYGTTTVLTGAGNDGLWFTADDNTATTSGLGNPFTFTGRRQESGSEMYYCRQRYLESETGSFVARPPSARSEPSNPYEYVSSRPSRYTDPHGDPISVTMWMQRSPQGLPKPGGGWIPNTGDIPEHIVYHKPLYSIIGPSFTTIYYAIVGDGSYPKAFLKRFNFVQDTTVTAIVDGKVKPDGHRHETPTTVVLDNSVVKSVDRPGIGKVDYCERLSVNWTTIVYLAGPKEFERQQGASQSAETIRYGPMGWGWYVSVVNDTVISKGTLVTEGTGSGF